MSSKPIFLSVRRNGSSPIFHIPFPSKLSLKSSYFPTFSWEFFFSFTPLLRLSKIAHLSPTHIFANNSGLDPPNTPKRLYRNHGYCR